MPRKRGLVRLAGRVRHLPASIASGMASAIGEVGFSRLAASPLLPLRLVRDALIAERERWPLWLPVQVGAGIGIYYALPFEPPAVMLIPMALALIACRLIAGTSGSRRPDSTGIALASWSFTVLSPVALGFAVAQWQTLRTATVILPQTIPAVTVYGTVEQVEAGERSLRLVLRRDEEAPPIAGVRLRRLRITVRTDHPDILPGDRLRVFARLEPPSAPVMPDGFDPARREWLRGIGALAYALAQPRILPMKPEDESVFARILAKARHSIAAWRQAVAKRIHRFLPDIDGGLAIALLTGQRGWLTARTTQEMRDAGLAHLLAISGLHLGLVAGLVFAVARLLLAFFPAIALTFDAKKPAAFVALLAAAGYLLLSGGNVATERAFLMTGLALVAVMVGRDPFSMRLVAFAALVLLLLRPSDLLEPGFQMSFAAVVALIGVYEAWSMRSPGASGRSQLSRREKAGRYLLGVLATTLIAEAAIAPFAVFHFHVLSRYGLLANLVAVPVTAFWVMPSGVLSLFAMPFGLEAWPLRAMAAGLSLVRETAHEVANLDGARWAISGYPSGALALIAFSGCWAMIWQSSRLRVLALLPLSAAFVVMASAPLPDVLVDGQGRLIGVRDGGTLFVNDMRKARGARRRWQQALGLGRVARWDRPPTIDGIARPSPMACGRPGCLVEIPIRAGSRLFLLETAGDLVARGGKCPAVDVLIVPEERTGENACRPTRARIGARRLGRRGAHAFFVDRASGAIRIETVAAARGRRPWSPPPAGLSEGTGDARPARR